MRRLLHKHYGDSPLHLLAGLAGFAIAAAGLVRFVDEGAASTNVVLWFAGALLAHDLIAYPLYTVLDRMAGRVARPAALVPAVNYVRVPVAIAGTLLLVYAPFVLGLGQQRFDAVSGRHGDVYLGRWLAITGALLAGSAVLYAVALRRAKARAG